MTDKEIIKGLEKELYHADYHDLDYEDNVPVSLLKNAYTLIIRQQAEIEELNTEIDKQYEQAVADIKGNLANGGVSCHWCIEQTKAGAIKEFAENLKYDWFRGFNAYGIGAIHARIDAAVKEMVGAE